MLEQLSAATQAQGWVIGVMLLFLAAFIIIVVRVFTGEREDYEVLERMALGDDHEPDGTAPVGSDQQNQDRV